MHHCADACTTMYLWSFNIYFHQTFCYFNLLTELSKSNDKKRGKRWWLNGLIQSVPPSPPQTLVFVLIYFILSEHPVAFQGPLCSWWRGLLFGRNLPSQTSALPWCRSSLISRAAVGSTAACRFDGNWIWYRIVACMEANNGLCSFLCLCTIRETQLNNLVQ